MPIEREIFGTLGDGRTVDAIRLRTERLDVRILTLGATVQSLSVQDANGIMADIVLGHDTPQDYLDRRQFFGATIGRFSNRIGGAGFELDGQRIAIPTNDGANVLHGGPDGFDRRIWTIEDVNDGAAPSVTLSLVSPDGDQGLPGEVQATVTYTLTASSELTIAFQATTDRRTVVGMTHHGYFNLAGIEHLGAATDHHLEVAADRFLGVDSTLIPQGEPLPVGGTPFDFRQSKPIARDIRENHPQLLLARGYDHCFCLSESPLAEPRLAARLSDPKSGRVMEILTDQPGLQVYSGNMLDATSVGKNGRIARAGDALCLEPQGWPDAPNRPDFPSVRLDPGQTYRHVSIYRFSTL